MSNLHLILIVQNHHASLTKNTAHLKSITPLITAVDLQSTDGSYELLVEQGINCEQCTPEDLSGTVNRLFNSVQSDFVMVMYGNEVLKGDIREQLVHVPAEATVANLSVRAPSWSSDILSREDFFWEARVFRSGFDVNMIGTARLYPVLEPDVNMVALSAAIDRNVNAASPINTEALFRLLQKGHLSLVQLKTLLNTVPEELLAIYKNPSLSDELNSLWEAAQNDLSQLSAPLQILYPLSLLTTQNYERFGPALTALCDAGEQGQASPHTVYLALLASAQCDIERAHRDAVLSVILEQAERLADFAEDDFAEDRLAGDNSEKSNHVCCIVALRQEDTARATELAEDLNMSSLAGIETQLLVIECMQNQGDGEALQASLGALEPLLGYHGFADAWLLSACGCVLLDKLDDIESLWQPAYLQSRQGFVSPHRRHVLSGMFAMISMLSGNPIEGHGAYGMLGALMRRRPITAIHSLPRSVIERSVNAMLMHNHLDYLTPLFERRAEVMVPGIRDYVIQHLNGLGFPVEDDGEPQPIFVIGDHHSIFQACFGNASYFQHAPGACVPSEAIETLYDKLTESREKEFDAFSWLDEAEGESEEELLEQLKAACRAQLDLQNTDKALRVIDPTVSVDDLQILTEGLGDGTALIVIEDPRDFVARKGVSDEGLIMRSLLEWERNIVQLRNLFQSKNYRYIETTPWLMLQNPVREMNRISASIGEAMPFEQFDAVMTALTQYQQRPQASEAVVAAVVKHGEAQLRRFGFPV